MYKIGIFNIASTDARCLFHQEVPLQKLTQRLETPWKCDCSACFSEKLGKNLHSGSNTIHLYICVYNIQFKMYWLIQQVKVNLSYSTILIHQLGIISSKFIWLQSVTKLKQFPLVHIQLPSYHRIVESSSLCWHILVLLDQSQSFSWLRSATNATRGLWEQLKPQFGTWSTLRGTSPYPTWKEKSSSKVHWGIC